MTAQRYFISIDDLSRARGESPELSFTGNSPASFAAAFEDALRHRSLWERWKAKQKDPDSVDAATGVKDPDATVTATQSDLHCDVEVVTSLPHALMRHRLDLLIGHNWKLRDVRAA
ncbi:MAG: hypothetical protein ABI451_02480 [Dokdonella sp.]